MSVGVELHIMFSPKAQSFPRLSWTGLPTVNYGLYYKVRLNFLEVSFTAVIVTTFFILFACTCGSFPL